MPRISNMKLQINAQNMLLCNRSYILLGFNCVQSCIDHKLLHVRYRSYICRQFGNNVAVCKRSVENNHDSSFCLWEPCLNFYVETVSNNTGRLCIHILFVHRNTTWLLAVNHSLFHCLYIKSILKEVIRLDYEDNIQLVKKETMKYLKTSMLDSVLESQTTTKKHNEKKEMRAY